MLYFKKNIEKSNHNKIYVIFNKTNNQTNVKKVNP
jgi:hypothetical protein